MRVYKTFLVLLLTFFFAMQAGAKKKNKLVGVSVKSLGKGFVTITIRLNKPAAIVLYYDNQKPRNSLLLHTFWFFEKSSVRQKKHVIKIGDIRVAQAYYFRVEVKGGARNISKLMSWIIKRPGRDNIKIRKESFL